MHSLKYQVRPNENLFLTKQPDGCIGTELKVNWRSGLNLSRKQQIEEPMLQPTAMIEGFEGGAGDGFYAGSATTTSALVRG
jgi:hypothetical protein